MPCKLQPLKLLQENMFIITIRSQHRIVQKGMSASNHTCTEGIRSETNLPIARSRVDCVQGFCRINPTKPENVRI